MQDHAHHHLRSVQHLRDFLIVVAFVVTQHKHLAGGLSQTGHRLANQRLQLAIGVFSLRALKLAFQEVGISTSVMPTDFARLRLRIRSSDALIAARER